MLIDTLKTKENLQNAGFSDSQARELVETFSSLNEQVATKAFVRGEVDGLRKDMETGMEALRKDIWRIGFVIGGFYTGVFSLIVMLFMG